MSSYQDFVSYAEGGLKAAFGVDGPTNEATGIATAQVWALLAIADRLDVIGSSMSRTATASPAPAATKVDLPPKGAGIPLPSIDMLYRIIEGALHWKERGGQYQPIEQTWRDMLTTAGVDIEKGVSGQSAAIVLKKSNQPERVVNLIGE